MICSWKEGELVTETEDITDSTRIEVFVQLTCGKCEFVLRRRTFRGEHTHRNRVHLPLHDDGRALASEQIDGMANLSVLHGQARLVLVVFLQEATMRSIRIRDHQNNCRDYAR